MRVNGSVKGRRAHVCQSLERGLILGVMIAAVVASCEDVDKPPALQCDGGCNTLAPPIPGRPVPSEPDFDASDGAADGAFGDTGQAPDGTTDSGTPLIDGALELPDGSVLLPDGNIDFGDGGELPGQDANLADAGPASPEGSVELDDGGVPLGDGGVELSDGGVELGDGNVELDDGGVPLGDGSVRLP